MLEGLIFFPCNVFCCVLRGSEIKAILTLLIKFFFQILIYSL